MMRFLFLSFVLFSSVNLLANELSQYSANRLQKAQELVQSENVNEAISLLESISTTRAFDRALIARTLGVYYWQVNQIEPAIEQLDIAVKSGLLQDEQAWVTQRMLADLLLSEQKYQRALSHYYELTEHASTTQQSEDTWLRIAQAHYQIEQWQQTGVAAEKSLSFNPSNEVPALSLLLAAQLQLKQWTKAITTTKALIIYQPENSGLWRQLVRLQLMVKKDKDALTTLSLAKLQHVVLKQGDLRLLAQLYAKHGIPERAAITIAELDKAETDIQLLVEQAYYWQQAKEWNKAISIWALAAKQDRRYHWNHAQLLMQQGRYQQSLQALNLVDQREAEVALSKARVFYKLNQLENALIEAKKAEQMEPSAQAKSWIEYLSQLRNIKEPISG